MRSAMTATLQDTESETDRLRALNDLRAALVATRDPRTLFSTVCSIAGRVLRHDEARLVLFTPGVNDVHVFVPAGIARCHRGVVGAGRGTWGRFGGARRVSGAAAVRRKRVGRACARAARRHGRRDVPAALASAARVHGRRRVLRAAAGRSDCRRAGAAAVDGDDPWKRRSSASARRTSRRRSSCSRRWPTCSTSAWSSRRSPRSRARSCPTIA